MDFTTAKDEVAERSQDTSSAHKTRCGQWLNLTKDEMCAFSDSWDWLEKTADLAITAADQEYALTEIGSDVAALFDIRVESNSGWKFLTYSPSEFDALYPDLDLVTGRPEGFTIWNATIILDRSPDDAYTAKVKYYRTVTDLSADADTFPWPTRWDWVALQGAMRYAFQFNDDSRAREAENAFSRGLREMLANQARYRSSIVIGNRMSYRPSGSPWPVNRFAY